MNELSDDFNKKLSLETDIKEKKTNKKNLTAFWGVSISLSVILQNELITKCLSENKNLIVLTKPIHTTLLYVGKKPDNPNESSYNNKEGKKCVLIIDSFGYSGDALALKVSSIKYINDSISADVDSNVPSYATIQHITLALKKGIPAKDSINALVDGTIIKFDIPIVIISEIKRYLF